MTRTEKEQRVLKEDGKVFEIKNLEIKQTYLNPMYRLVGYDPSVLKPTGHLAIFELRPLSGNGPSFIARWDGGSRDEGREQRQDLDIDIEGVSKRERLRFERGEDGYCGHHSGKLHGMIGHTYRVSIVTPAQKIFEATVNFSVLRKIEFSEKINMSATNPN